MGGVTAKVAARLRSGSGSSGTESVGDSGTEQGSRQRWGG